ncbi:MAG TPA: hypothetical protein VF511_00365, partial [Chthoniobacterales bacterium]
MIVAAYALVNKIAPIGGDPSVFAVSGLLPYIICMYPARLMAMAILQNKPLLNFMIVRPIHLMVSRCILEIINASLVVVITFAILASLGMDVAPADKYEAAAAISGSIYLGIGFGFFNTILVSLFGMVGVVLFVIVMIGLYMTSGAITPITFLPPDLKSLLAYNPLMHCVEWFRYAYFHQNEADLDRFYVIEVGSLFLFLGLLSE